MTHSHDPTPTLCDEPWNDPAHREAVPCPLCEAPPDDAIVVGTRARFGMAVRNVACHRCGLVHVSPRPTPAAMDAYYRGPYRAQYRNVKLPAPGGGFVGPDDAGYHAARVHRYRQQAAIAATLGGTPPGGRVLEVGCRDGQTLANLRDEHGLRVFGVEPGPAEAQTARERGVEVFVGLLEEYAPDGEGFDQVQMFHVLEHLHDPLGALSRLASWLKPDGRLIIEVPNVTHPYGPLEGNFFQNAHLFSFSANTLRGLFVRAGLRVERLVDGNTLFVVGTPEAVAEAPRPFGPDTVPHPEQDGAWIATRLDTYRHLERLRAEIRGGAANMDRLGAVTQLLRRPGFATHTTETVRDLVDFFARVGAPRAAMAVATAAAAGPHPVELISFCHRVVAECRARLGQ
ncbi:MAG TPA: class I SAM-dependent methyltransferase, partial [Sandaracinaceae bacterium LLY-WYZ-13_1]|nr:class I SAM-dependent methyltransferase [Sandaracinaceae bacterium LLY-WYZ-13_1]